MAKRVFDLFFSGLGLLLLAPLLLVLAVLVKCADGGPVFFRQRRVGLRGKEFLMWKFRSMVPGAEKIGSSVTRRGDSRVTPLGRWLRRSKLDELPQLWNVFRGDMSLVGPRPEVPGYVALYTPEQRRVLELRPGITDLASLAFRDEEELLKQAPDMEMFYREVCIPKKIELNLGYRQRANLWEDTKIILRTLLGGRIESPGELPGGTAPGPGVSLASPLSKRQPAEPKPSNQGGGALCGTN